jgi:hypothetical protein
MFLADMLGLAKAQPVLSLAVTVALLAASLIWRLVKMRQTAAQFTS